MKIGDISDSEGTLVSSVPPHLLPIPPFLSLSRSFLVLRKLEQIFLFCALACVCASIYIDFFNQMPRSRKRQIMGLRVFVTVVLIGVLAATKEPRFINCIQVRMKRGTVSGKL